MQELLDWKRLKLHQNGFEDPDLDMRALKNSQTLCDLAGICHVSINGISAAHRLNLYIEQGMSGRTLRRLPLLAHARYSARSSNEWSFEDELDDEEDLLAGTDDECTEYAASTAGEELDSVEIWLEAMLEAVKAEQDQMERVEENSVFSRE